jgi:hypothetical protein
MTPEEAKIWKEGFEAGVRATEQRNSKAVKIGNAILDVMYETFETAKETY